MNPFKRWLMIRLTCYFGFHLPLVERQITSGVKLRECPRCRCSWVSTKYIREHPFSRPTAWDVARGLYDKTQHYEGDK